MDCVTAWSELVSPSSLHSRNDRSSSRAIRSSSNGIRLSWYRGWRVEGVVGLVEFVVQRNQGELVPGAERLVALVWWRGGGFGVVVPNAL